jgi:hypothetical protein
MKVRLTLVEGMLGTASANPQLHEEFIAGKAPDGEKTLEEIAALPMVEQEQRSRTVFPRLPDGKPGVWDYQIKGFFKDACGMLRRVADTKSAGLKAYTKVIDGLVFVSPRLIPIACSGPIGECVRPLRASGPQGDRVALAASEEVPAGSVIEFEVSCLNASLETCVREWLDYGKLRGLGQWRNSGKGRFTVEVTE